MQNLDANKAFSETFVTLSALKCSGYIVHFDDFLATVDKVLPYIRSYGDVSITLIQMIAEALSEHSLEYGEKYLLAHQDVVMYYNNRNDVVAGANLLVNVVNTKVEQFTFDGSTYLK